MECVKPSDCHEGTVVCTQVRYQVRKGSFWSDRGYEVERVTCDYRTWTWHPSTLARAKKLIAKQIYKDERDRLRGKIRWYLRYEPRKPLPPVVYEVRHPPGSPQDVTCPERGG